MIGTAVVDAECELGGFEFDTAPRWHVLVLSGAMPSARVDMPNPGVTSGDALARAALVRRADAERARIELITRLRARMGSGPSRPARSIAASVVVCTHRRPSYLRDLCAGLRDLSPSPIEIIVVDNDPGEEDCRAEVEQAGFRYIREDRRGLDNARNAGLRAARGEVIVFTDDDCVPPAAWLAPLERAFSHEGVVAVTGPAFPYALDTPARVRMEHQASLARGLQRVAFDWQTISPLHAAAMGVGANMAIRRSSLLDLGAEPFPPELDAGTETESGGDMYVLSRLLARGGRVVYDPEMFTFHQHRPDAPALRRALVGYGVGLSAALTKLLVQEHELTVPRAWVWLLKQYWQTQRRRVVGRADAVETRLSWEYLRGGFLGTGRWCEALRTQHEISAAPVENDRGSGTQPAWPIAPDTDRSADEAAARSIVSLIAPDVSDPDGSGEPVTAPVPRGTGTGTRAGDLRVSVIVPTFRREQALARCLDALARQDLPPAAFEVIVVDDDARRGASPDLPNVSCPFALRCVGGGGAGAAGARNEGARHANAPLLLFLDDDVVADPWLVRCHAQWHDRHGAPAILVGHYRPCPRRRNLAAVVACLWWQDMFHLLRDAHGMTFVVALTANVSFPRTIFDELGGFAEEFSRQRREDWEWGLRMLEAGVPLAYEPAASARHEFTLSTAQRLRDARREGVGDTVIAELHPQALPSLPLMQHRPPTPREPARWFGFGLWRLPAVRRVMVLTLDLLEVGNLREAWVRLFRLAQSAAYAQGVRDGRGSRAQRERWKASSGARSAPSGDDDASSRLAAPDARYLDVELLSSASIPAPTVAAPVVRVMLRGAEVTRVFPAEGIWNSSLAEQVVDAMPPAAVARAAEWGGWLSQPAEAHGHCEEVEVIFGPANPPSDSMHRDELESVGALVRVLDGDPREHWGAVSEAVRTGDRALVAIALPGTAPGPAWLAESLSAFDGERVGLVFGGRLPSEDPPEPLYLHDRRSTSPTLLLAGEEPAYLVLRRRLAGELRPTGDMLGPIMGVVSRALEDGWVIGHRSVRGLEPPACGKAELGEAYGRLEVTRLAGTDGVLRARAVGASATRGLVTLGWHMLKQRGRLTPAQRGLAAGIARGATQTVLAGRMSRQ